MAVYRSRHALPGPLTPDRVLDVTLPRTPFCRRGYRVDEVDALLCRLAHELRDRTRQLDLTRAENHRIKEALRTWQTRHAEERSRNSSFVDGVTPPDRPRAR
ncbi:DivIVA domain-containing protein [Micromonospora echinofusca]|uniref:DivIVA domain-containing protein n=1 Tax=Micromonospora echinofusca TaxID=47858 RepID=UPI0033E23506